MRINCAAILRPEIDFPDCERASFSYLAPITNTESWSSLRILWGAMALARDRIPGYSKLGASNWSPVFWESLETYTPFDPKTSLHYNCTFMLRVTFLLSMRVDKRVEASLRALNHLLMIWPGPLFLRQHTVCCSIFLSSTVLDIEQFLTWTHAHARTLRKKSKTKI